MKSEMTFRFGCLTRTHLIALCLLACAGFATLAVSAHAWLTRPAAVAEASALAAQTKMEVELVTLKRWGFEPKEITRPKGRFLLVINNRAEQSRQLTFSLADERRNRLKDVKLGANGKKNSNDLYDLSPGAYLLTVAEFPEWVCRITITNK
ncbi:MAG: hypothetical protein AB7U82_29820 [Blastocatellales bacterium]